MATEILMPKLGLTMKEGTVVSWLKSEGESIAEKEIVLDIETEKLSYSVESPASGVILKRLADEGEKYPVSAVLGYIGKPGEAVPDQKAHIVNGASAHSELRTQQQERITNMGETQYRYPESGEAVIILDPNSPPSADTKQQAEYLPINLPDHADSGARIFISPVAKKLAAELRIDYRLIRGTGPNGRIVKADVLKYEKEDQAANAMAVGLSGRSQGIIEASSPWAEARGSVIPYSGLRRAVGETMKRAWETIPMVTHHVSADAGAVLDYRRMLNAGVEDNAARVTVGELMLKLTAAAISLMPVMNSSLTDDGIILHSHINVGMATALDDGLIVPVIQDADTKGLLTVSREAKDLSTRARSGALTPDDVHGATFTVSNLGGYGSVDFFTPIINPPQAAILGIGRTVDTAVPINGEVGIRPMIGLSLTYDHRLVDGATAAAFIKLLMALMENPARAVLS